MTLCGNSLPRSLSGEERTCLIALQMSAYDPKRRWACALQMSAIGGNTDPRAMRTKRGGCANGAPSQKEISLWNVRALHRIFGEAKRGIHECPFSGVNVLDRADELTE
jgi:hypothetical protein